MLIKIFRNGNYKNKIIFLLVMLFALTLIFYQADIVQPAPEEDTEGFSEYSESENNEPEAVEVVQARESGAAEEKVFDGFTEPISTTKVIPGVGGDVQEIRANVGQEVQAGELLARLEAEALDLGLKAGEEALNQARLEMEMAQTGAREEELQQAKAQYEAASESLKLAEDAYERAEYLYKNDVIPRNELDEAEGAYIEARAQYQAAEQDLNMAREGARPEEIEMARSAIAEAEYELEQARLSQEDLNVTAPVSGTVGMVPIEEGMMIGEDTTVAVIMDIDRLHFVVESSARRFADISTGQRAELTFDSQPDESYTGYVEKVYPAADEDSGQFEFKIAFDNPGHAIKAGEYGEARIQIGEDEPGVEVPASAVKTDEDPHIYHLEDQMLRRSDVSIHEEKEDSYIITGNISRGDLLTETIEDEYYDGYEAEYVEVVSW